MTTMTRVLLSLFLSGGLSACSKKGYDADASAAYRAAWEKRRAGDEAGYKQGLAEVAKKRGTWAGDRAALDLDIVDETYAGSLLGNLLRQALLLRVGGGAGDAPSDAPPAPSDAPSAPEEPTAE